MSLYWIVPTVAEESRVPVRTDDATMPTGYWALISDPASPEREPGKRHVPEKQGLGHCLDSVQARVAEKHPELIVQCVTRDFGQERLCSSIEKHSERYKQDHHSISEGITDLSGITLQAQWETFWWRIRKNNTSVSMEETAHEKRKISKESPAKTLYSAQLWAYWSPYTVWLWLWCDI